MIFRKKRQIFLLLALLLPLCFTSCDSSVAAGRELSERPVIVLDAGHGGQDGGAVAKDGTLEKDLNLCLTKDAAVISFGVLFIHTNTWLQPFGDLCHVFAGALRGRGDSRGPMIIMLSTFVGLRQLYLFLITRFVVNTPVSVGIGYPVGWLTCCATMAIYYRFRVKRKVASITV